MSGPITERGAGLSALRLVSFIPHARDAVHAGLLTPDARQVVDLAHFGINDALDAFEHLAMLRQTAGAIVHGAARTVFAVGDVHLVAPIPLVRSVIRVGDRSAPHFADPATLHGPGGHLGRIEAAGARVGLAAVVGEILETTHRCPDDQLEQALSGSVLVIGWPHAGPDGAPMLMPGAIGPFVAVPRRRPESLMLTHVAPLDAHGTPDTKQAMPAPADAAFMTLAREALRTHTLRPGDLLTIFPQHEPERPLDDAVEHGGALQGTPIAGGSWIRASAPGLGTLSLAVR